MIYFIHMNKPTTLKFNTFNTRRNLPPETGRKRGEANFLGAFERHLTSKVFESGYGGRNFPLFNYGIADLVWLIPQKTKQDAYNGATLYAFETKLKNWRRAFQQAYRYSYYSDATFVVLPPEKSRCAVENIDLFQMHGIGLWLFDSKNSCIEKVHTPTANSARNSAAKSKAIAALSAKIKH